MNDNLLLKATVTGKRQITIPKEICDLLNIEKGQQVVFKKEGNKIIFDKEQEYCSCFACNETGRVDGKPCFVCRGNGKLQNEIINDIYKLVGFISMTSAKYGLSISFIQNEPPVIKLKSGQYSITELQRIQDKLQKLIIEQFSKRRELNG